MWKGGDGTQVMVTIKLSLFNTVAFLLINEVT